MSGDEQNWVPLESNPELMTKFLWNIGVSDEWSVVDVIGLDDELLQFIGGPVVALIVLHPLNEDKEPVESNDQNLVSDLKDVFYMRQTIHNACGTIALIHSVGNNCDRIQLKPNSTLKTFFDASRDLSPEERGKLLESNADICNAHHTSAREGQSEVPTDSNLIYHFTALVQKNGTLYQLSGRKGGIISRGPSSEETFLSDAARVCREFIAKDPNNLAFTVLALSKQNPY